MSAHSEELIEDVFPEAWRVAIEIMGRREAWVLRPQTRSDIPEYMSIIEEAQLWASDMCRAGLALEPDNLDGWKLMAYLQSDIFIGLLSLLIDGREASELARTREFPDNWIRVNGQRLGLLDAASEVSSVFSADNVRRLRRMLVI